jgi:hypothetical protein
MKPMPTDTFRNWLALSVSLSSIVLILVLAVALIVCDSKKVEVARLVLTAVLPLIGSWVGTILAYFFSSENLRAATNSVATLAQLSAQDRLRSVPGRDKMIPRAAMKGVVVGALNRITVLQGRQKLDADQVNRLIVLDPNDVAQLVLHRSTLDRFLVTRSLAQAQPQAPAALANLTLQDIVEDPAFKPMLATTFAMVREDATLADAKAVMEALPNCHDVLVTRNGTRNEPVLGWVTNVIIRENARV